MAVQRGASAAWALVGAGLLFAMSAELVEPVDVLLLLLMLLRRQSKARQMTRTIYSEKEGNQS